MIILLSRAIFAAFLPNDMGNGGDCVDPDQTPGVNGLQLQILKPPL